MSNDDIGEAPTLPTASVNDSQTSVTNENQTGLLHALFESVPIGNEHLPVEKALEQLTKQSED